MAEAQDTPRQSVKFDEIKIQGLAVDMFGQLARLVNLLFIEQAKGPVESSVYEPHLKHEVGNAIALIMRCRHDEPTSEGKERNGGDGAVRHVADRTGGADDNRPRPEVAAAVPARGGQELRGVRKPTIPHQGGGQKKGLQPKVIAGNVRGEVARATAPISDADSPAGPTSGLEHLLPKV
jgi:hypothetical protein